MLSARLESTARSFHLLLKNRKHDWLIDWLFSLVKSKRQSFVIFQSFFVFREVNTGKTQQMSEKNRPGQEPNIDKETSAGSYTSKNGSCFDVNLSFKSELYCFIII